MCCCIIVFNNINENSALVLIVLPEGTFIKRKYGEFFTKLGQKKSFCSQNGEDRSWENDIFYHFKRYSFRSCNYHTKYARFSFKGGIAIYEIKLSRDSNFVIFL